MFYHLFDPLNTTIQTAAAWGSITFLAAKRNMGWIVAATIFAVGQVTAFYFTMPFALWWQTMAYGLVAFLFGLLSYLLWGSVIQIAQNLHDDPRGTISWVVRLWKGRGDDRQRGEDDNR